MASVGKILRRSFLIGSTAIVGGVAFGAYAVSRPAPNPLKPGDGEAALNPFVFIDQQGVTLITPRAEMGQGVQSTWAAMIAEELDVNLDDVRVLHGPPAKAYYNSAFGDYTVFGKGYDRGEWQHAYTEAIGHVAKLVNLQITGGSASTRDGFVRLREAGATARETLKEAAAQRLGVSRDSLRTEGGKVIAPDGQELTYAQLAEDAARVNPVDAPLRDASNWRYLGKPMDRIDMVPKATGTAEFGVDVRLPGMKFAALRMNPRLGGNMLSFDASAASEMPGVEQIVDLGRGVAVIATNTWLAVQACDAIGVEWGPAPYPETSDAIYAEIARSFDGRANSRLRNDGDVTDLPEGAQRIEAEYKVPYLAHATMEPMNATARFTGDALEIWCGTQAPTLVQWDCAKRAGLETDQVTVHTTYLGGGFGRRAELDFANLATQVAMAMPGTPVQLTWTREEDMTHGFYRPAAVARMSGAVLDGQAVMIDGQVAAQPPIAQMADRMAGLPLMGPDKVLVEGFYNQPYAVPNYRMRGYLADLAVPVGIWRSVGNSHNAFFQETFIDEMAHAAGRDPLEFRLELMRTEHAPSAACLEAVREMSGWTGKTPDGVGRGVAFCYSFGTSVAQVVEVVDEDGTIRVNKAWLACDPGLAVDPENIKAQMFGGMIFGLSAACFEEISFADGQVEQLNYPDYPLMRMHTAPEVEIRILENNAHMGGAGEPGTPPAMPALGNALFDLTGIRARELPFIKTFDLLI
ncbi:xanthine dehydrogenase family protein molybdopterin-binding subunit [Aestuariivita boseongensis]|uniref:xanthine dehydrogenase family protein molybdopterin-binding subunit n=1 Tax=Aestuariivita boseongensis TaxID=1470562 RepID=UPI0006800CF1|nr:molybdopterin cofactor-binding domain-containing protein [Aestuariivita boseongensis]